jgi:hypothetical protein
MTNSITYSFTIKQRDPKPNPGITRWERSDYSTLNDSEIYSIVTHKQTSAKTIQRILKTARFGPSVITAAQHKLAQIEDILELVYKNNHLPKMGYTAILYNNMIDNLFILKREQVNAYLKTTYDLETQHMTETHIKEMLGL